MDMNGPGVAGRTRRLLACWIAVLCAQLVRADEHSHRYKDGEQVTVWMDTVGPFDNMQERYSFLSLPFCVGSKDVEHHHETLGEALLGVKLVNYGIDIKFKENVDSKEVCRRAVSASPINKFRSAIKENYMYQMFIDDLPAHAFVGGVNEKNGNVDLYTHKRFSFSYNGDRIIEVNVTSDTDSGKVTLPENGPLNTIYFTYSVEWKPTTASFANRYNKYLDTEFFEQSIHWFSILNSFMMVLFLAGIVSIILYRTLRRDLARYDREVGLLDLDRDLGDEYGWKQVHGDVFRTPPRLTLLSAYVGIGVQLMALAFVLILYVIARDLYIERASVLTSGIFLYAVTSFIAGYTAGKFYHKYGGKNWVKTALLTTALLPTAVAVVACVVNFGAIGISSTRAIPFGSMVAVLGIFLLTVVPLTLLGYIAARNFSAPPNWPCRVNPIPRPIPDKPWYAEPWVLVSVAAMLPFGSIFVEMYYVWQSFWSYRVYYVYGFLLLMFIMLLIVSACTAVVSTYFLLNSEDHRWHWHSFQSSGCAAGYIFLYSLYYYSRTTMHGTFQALWYFSYTALLCFGLFIMLGTIGHISAEKFVRKVFAGVKVD
ncbi:hypothetical protein HDU85_003311 [Gaertneriomyces sp. JEL0708]|nr:hypothetical protein HDU85_003311 [Gaertneriomyces sp. JEL0708]